MSIRPPTIVYCQCRYSEVVPAAVKEAVLQHLCDSGRPFEPVADLCDLCAHADPALARLAASGPLRIVACFPRAVRWLFAAAGAPLDADTCEVLNMRTLTAAEVIARMESTNLEPNLAAPRPALSIESSASPSSPVSGPESIAERVAALRRAPLGPPPWMPWFPVIDRDRCTNCHQCLSFCLFGVYGLDEENRIRVQRPDQCKPLCPACARVCPEAAIMFPKYKAGPINGDTVSDADLQREKVKVDIGALLSADVYQMLHTRSERAHSRFGKERDADQALKERQKYLQALGDLAADVPPELLHTLPAPEEIARRVADVVAARKSPSPPPKPS